MANRLTGVGKLRAASLSLLVLTGFGSACSLVVDSSKNQCSTDGDCVAKGPDFSATVCKQSMCVKPRGIAGKCVGTLSVKGIMTLTGPTSEVGIPYSLGIKDYFREINQLPDKLMGCTIDYDPQDDHYDPVEAQRLWDNWKQDAAGWKNVVQVMTWGTDTTLRLSPLATTEKKPIVSASYNGTLSAPVAATQKANVPEVNTSFDETSLQQEYKSQGYPYNFFAGTDYSTSIRTALYHAKTSGAKRVAFFYCGTAGYCKGPIPAGRSYTKDPNIQLKLGRDLDIALSGEDDKYDAKILDYFTKELEYKKAHPDYEPVDWVWIGNTERTAALAAIAVDKAYKALKPTNPAMPQIQLMVNVYGFDEGLFPKCGPACVDNVHGVLPFLAFDDKIHGSTEMQKVVALHDKWRAADGTDAGAGVDTRSAKYVQGYVSAMMFKLAVERLVKEGTIVTPDTLKSAYESFSPAGMDTGGLSAPLTFSKDDHRPQSTVTVYRIDATGKLISESDRTIARQPEWLGW